MLSKQSLGLVDVDALVSRMGIQEQVVLTHLLRPVEIGKSQFEIDPDERRRCASHYKGR